MYISNSTYDELNKFLCLNFQMNSFCDNIAYNLGYQKLVGIEPIFHERFAHAFPGFADIVSELMLKLEARPVRLALEQNNVEYSNVVDMFADLKDKVDNYRVQLLRTIEVADINNDMEVKIDLETFAAHFTKYLDQVNLWNKKAQEYNSDITGFDHDFDKFTKI